ncbi:malto-oligosyltrehalose synthase [Halodurantibacterium flavum]|uniref:Malto-oligosyltrehalose synthase n=1 Tax=Halodurantibacterium flavum TaxID=1382802 RepID=A0ABW4S551_9RHOB
MIPLRATYRLQFTADFTFADGAALAPYLAQLGVSHVYASPVFAARPGSTHGYDVTDYNRINPELGTEADFRAMAQVFRERGLGLILDFVPNHMGIGGDANAFWQSVLEWGPDSPWAHWFDIDWNAPGFPGKVLFPFLGAPYGVVLRDGGLDLRLDEGGRIAVWAHDSHRLPVCSRDYAEVLRRAGSSLAGDFEAMTGAAPDDPRWPALHERLWQERPDLSVWRDPGLLDGLVRRQHWRAAKFNLDGDAINYRRFFTISDLAGVRVERAEVFEETHALMLSLLREGVADGIRIDHIDGLRDPKAYCLRLRQAVGRPFPLYVEKILGPDEHLPPAWEADGTTGYEFANEVVTLLADPAGTATLGEIYSGFTGQTLPPAEIVHEAKLRVVQGPMLAEAEAVTTHVMGLAGQVPDWADLGRGAVRSALGEVIASLDIYRSYADADGIAPEGRARVLSAIERARLRAPEIDPAAWDLIASVLTIELGDRLPDQRDAVIEAAMRFQQLSGPVMAKGLEDRSLYRFNRLIALNEVGSEPGHFNLAIASFHLAQADRLRLAPRNMLGTSSHDTKRGEDARMRIVAISSHTGLWQQKVAEWRALLADASAPVDPNEEYFFYQLLIGVWPDDEADRDDLIPRVTEAMLKSVREAGVNSRWVFGDEAYEGNIRALVERALGSRDFVASFTDFLRRIRPDAEANSLIQTALKLTVPGVPDIYQGAEMWDQSLVDPDNRRPVDFARRAALLPQLGAGPVHVAGRAGDETKLALVARLLALRAELPDLFARGSYEPLAAEGPAADGLLGFLRRWGDEMLLVAAALHPASHDARRWEETRIVLPQGAPARWQNLIDGQEVDPTWPAPMFRGMPLAILRPGGA